MVKFKNAKHVELNNMVNITNEYGEYIYLDKDNEALEDYIENTIKPNTLEFTNEHERFNFLLETVYDVEVFQKYSLEFIYYLIDKAYAFNFKFKSYMSAVKYYTDYCLKTNDNKHYLETFEFTSLRNALFAANGDKALAEDILMNLLLPQNFNPATPTYSNAGLKYAGEKVSCFILQVNDSLNDINMMISTAKQLSKIGGGVSINLSKIRALGESILGREGVAKGVVPIVNMLDKAFRYADQMGQRPGAGIAYLSIAHNDIELFINTKKITADEDVRAKTLSIGVVIPDIFMQLHRENKPFYTFFPKNVYDVYGKHLDEMNITEMYYELVNNPKIKKTKRDPRKIMQLIAATRFESGYPVTMYSDNVNSVNPNSHLGLITESNLCTEILQISKVSTYGNYGSEDKIGYDISCNLSSINLLNTIKSKKLEKATRLGIRVLNTVAKTTSIKNAPGVKAANDAFRSIGLGVMNLHGLFANYGIPYESKEALNAADCIFHTINYYSLLESCKIAKEENFVYEGFKGSKYDTGEYFEPFIKEDVKPNNEKVAKMMEGIYIPTAQDMKNLMKEIQKYGLAHSYRLAIPPTGGISYVHDATPGVMPIMQRIEERLTNKIKVYFKMPGLSAKTYFLYKPAYDINQFRLIDLVSTIQKYIDQGISCTIFATSDQTTRDIAKIEMYAHHKGIKTLYYLRTKNLKIDECESCKG